MTEEAVVKEEMIVAVVETEEVEKDTAVVAEEDKTRII